MDITAAALFLAFLLLWISWKFYFAPAASSRRNLHIPPSPGFALPIIGHLHLIGNLPHISFNDLSKRYGPCLMLKLGSRPSLLISSSEFAREALKVNDIAFSSRPNYLAAARILADNSSGVLWAPYGPQWRSLRKLCSLELLTSRRIEMSRPIRAAEVSAAISSISRISREGKCVNLTTILSDLTFTVMRVLVMGPESFKTPSSRDSFKTTMREAFTLGGDFHIGDYVPWLGWLDKRKVARMRMVRKTLGGMIQKEIDEHRNGGVEYKDDFISVVLQHDEVCDTDRVRTSLIEDVVAGGMDTSALTVEWAMAELVNHPEAMKRAQRELFQTFGKFSVDEARLEELEFLAAVVKETLRLHPPAPILIYETTQECQLTTYTIPEKTQVFINIYGIARSEESWIDPNTFDPGRFLHSDIDLRGRDFTVLPFGAGRRGCPGIQLGFTMVTVILANLLHEFEWSIPGDQSRLDMSDECGLTVPRAVPLELIAMPRT